MLLLILLGLLASIVHAVPTISAKGSKFFTSDGNQFFIKGGILLLSLYQPSSSLTPVKVSRTSSCQTTR